MLTRTSPMKRTAFKKKSQLGMKRSRMVKRNRNQYREEKFKKAVRTRDNFQCQFPGCFTRDFSIDVHHIAMRSRRPDLIFVHENAIALCRKHHDFCHRNQAKAVKLGLLSEDSYEAANRITSAVVETNAPVVDEVGVR